MPRVGQKSLTLSESVYNRVKEYFETHEKELRERGITSVPNLFQVATLTFIGAADEEIVRIPLRLRIVKGFWYQFEQNFSNQGYGLSAAHIINEATQFVADTRTKTLLGQNFQQYSDKSTRIGVDLNNILKRRELGDRDERQLQNVMYQIIMLMLDYLRMIVEMMVDVRKSENPKRDEMLKQMRGFYDRYLSIFVPQATLALTLTNYVDGMYQLTRHMDRNDSNSLAGALEMVKGAEKVEEPKR